MSAPTVRIGPSIYDETTETPEQVLAKYGLAKKVDGFTACVAWNGHEFEIVPIQAREWFWDEYNPHRVVHGVEVTPVRGKARELLMTVHYPIDPRMAASDVRGATVAYPNASNDGWLFAHADADWHDAPNTPNTCLLYTSPSPRDS